MADAIDGDNLVFCLEGIRLEDDGLLRTAIRATAGAHAGVLPSVVFLPSIP